MRLRVASYHCIFLLLLNNSIAHGLQTADKKKHDFRKTLSGSNSLMDSMIKKYSYPKSEVTAGVGYGHHLHPFYYQGEKEVMYPCAVECGEWESMSADDNANDASSNVDVVTVRPDVSNIEITTPKSRPYKDTSLLRPKKYKSALFSGGEKSASAPKAVRHGYQDSKGADLRIIPRKTSDTHPGEIGTTETPNDGSLYAKYQEALISGYDGELEGNNSENKENEYFDPMEESLAYNSPTFNDSENDDIEAPVYPTKIKSRPRDRGERIEEKYVKHNVREERLEDVRTNSFGSTEDGDKDLFTDFNAGKQPDSYNPPKYIDDYAAPIKPYVSYPPNKIYEKGESSVSDDEKHFGLNDPQIHTESHNPNAFYKNSGNKVPHRDYGGYSNYQAEENDGVERPVKSSYYDTSYQGRDYPQGRVPAVKNNRPPIYGRNQKYRPIPGVGYRRGTSSAGSSYTPNFEGILYSENGAGDPNLPRAPKHGYSSQVQKFPQRSNSGGIRVVPPPRIRHSRLPYSKRVHRTGPHFRGQRISYRRSIPQKNGFTKIVKKYKSFVDYTPKRFVGSGELYGT